MNTERKLLLSAIILCLFTVMVAIYVDLYIKATEHFIFMDTVEACDVQQGA